MVLSKKIFNKLLAVFIALVFFKISAFAQISTQQLGGSQINTITTAVPFLHSESGLIDWQCLNMVLMT